MDSVKWRNRKLMLVGIFNFRAYLPKGTYHRILLV